MFFINILVNIKKERLKNVMTVEFEIDKHKAFQMVGSGEHARYAKKLLKQRSFSVKFS